MEDNLKIGAVVLLLVALLGLGIAYGTSGRDVSFTVDSKERVCESASEGKQECKYLVFTDKGTFQITDTILFRRFNSSDVYGKMKEDQTYNTHVVGWRLPFFSKYPNVVEVK